MTANERFEKAWNSFLVYLNQARDAGKTEKELLACCAIETVRFVQIGYAAAYALPDMEMLREEILPLLEKNGRRRQSVRMLYGRYQAESDIESKKTFFIKKLKLKEQCTVILESKLLNDGDNILSKACEECYTKKPRYTLLQVFRDFVWENSYEVSAPIPMSPTGSRSAIVSTASWTMRSAVCPC